MLLCRMVGGLWGSGLVREGEVSVRADQAGTAPQPPVENVLFG